MTDKKAIILLSGGLDSATVLAIAKSQGFTPYALSFKYGQRHEIELDAARNVVASQGGVSDHKIAEIDLRLFGGSALTDEIAVPKERSDAEISDGIPITYVPARNTIFLSFALAYAEVVGAYDIFLGVNSVDYSGYPDCRPAYLESFENMANLALAATADGDEHMTIHAPLLTLSKQEIIAKGLELGVDYAVTLSCYDPDDQGVPCGQCDSCHLRIKGFEANGMQDPTMPSL